MIPTIDALRRWLSDPVLIRQSLRFGLSGLFVTGLHVVIAAGCINHLGFRPEIANGIAYVIATITSYTINTMWSFKSVPVIGNLLRFLAVAIGGLLLTMLITGIIDRLGFSYWLGIAAVVAVVPPLTFLLHRNWTYR